MAPWILLPENPKSERLKFLRLQVPKGNLLGKEGKGFQCPSGEMRSRVRSLSNRETILVSCLSLIIITIEITIMIVIIVINDNKDNKVLHWFWRHSFRFLWWLLVLLQGFFTRTFFQALSSTVVP